MSKNTQSPTLKLDALSAHFERDTHLLVQNARVQSVHVIHGETELEDVTVVQYADVPALSFYDVYGRLIDLDHYLPDEYGRYDTLGTEALLNSLRIEDKAKINSAKLFKEQLSAVLEAGKGSLADGLGKEYGVVSQRTTEEAFLQFLEVSGDTMEATLQRRFRTMRQLLLKYLQLRVASGNRYVHFTQANNIVITPLDKQCGLAVLIETRDERGRPLRPVDWRITRTRSVTQLEKALVFRSPDIQAFFEVGADNPPILTDRYSMELRPDRLLLDSLLDETDNLLEVPVHNSCFQILAADPAVVIVLSDARRVTLINSHKSVIPQKWVDTISLPEEVSWVQADGNLTVLFTLNTKGQLIAYKVTGAVPEILARMEGPYEPGFCMDQTGSLSVIAGESQTLLRIRTNVNDLQFSGQDATFAAVFKNLTEWFRGESLFNRITYAKKVTEDIVPAEDKLLTEVEVARFDFTTSIDHLMAAAGDDFEQLLEVRQKIAIARQNIEDEFTSTAEKAGIRLVGRRLQQTIENIVRPAERRVTALVESIRAGQLLEEVRSYNDELRDMNDPGAFRDVLASLRAANEELSQMAPDNSKEVVTEFRQIQEALNTRFSQQIAEDGTALHTFITKEIEQLEEAIGRTHEMRQLESLLTTHPAALELMSLLKQPFVLERIASERSLSPAGIQRRLHSAVEDRLNVLHKQEELRDAEKNAAKVQLAGMAREAIDFFIQHHSGGFSDLELSKTAGYTSILRDIGKLERQYKDARLAGELRQRLERVILDKNRKDLEKAVAYEGKYAFVQNDPELYVDLESTVRTFPEWKMELLEKSGTTDKFLATFIRNTDREVYRPSTNENLLSGRSFEVDGDHVAEYLEAYRKYENANFEFSVIDAVWKICREESEPGDFPQFSVELLTSLRPETETARRALGAAREKKLRDRLERTRKRNVPKISPEFIDETPYFQSKLREFFIKAKLQLGTGSGVLLLSGPPSTGKSAFLKFAAALMKREYFEHASDKWQTKNSLVTAVRFGENGPYTTPAGFTRAITTAYSLVNIEEIKEWPEALRKSLNPFFAGSKNFVAPDGTVYKIGDNILLCAAANLGSMYRVDDEAFTADFWSRIEVVEYDYAPHRIDEEYFTQLHEPVAHSFLTMQELCRYQFDLSRISGTADQRARSIARRLLSFLLLPKADDQIKRERLEQEITKYFETGKPENVIFGPEEAAKVALRRLRDLQSLTPAGFFDLYDHFINNRTLRDPAFARWQSSDHARYENLRLIFLTLYYLEGCLRHVRTIFQRSGGQSEIEGTNREFISAVYLLGLLGKLTG